MPHYTNDAVKRHSESAMHAEAVKLEKLRLVSQKSGGIVKPLKPKLNLEGLRLLVP